MRKRKDSHDASPVGDTNILFVPDSSADPSASGVDALMGMIDEAGAQILRDLTGDLSSDEALASVVERLRAHDVLEETRELARTWARDAVAALSALPKGEPKTALEAFANLMVDRLV